MGNDCSNKKGRLLDLCECRGHDGRPDPAPVDCEFFREQFAHGDEWTPKQRSRGIGDVIAKVTNAVGIPSCGGCKKRQNALNEFLPFKYQERRLPSFVTTAQLMEDARELASRLPADTSQIIGVARSGLCVASMIAMLIHRPMQIVRQSSEDIIPGGHGGRLTGYSRSDGPVVVVDDVVMTGNSFKHVMPIVRKQYPEAIGAALYCNPAANVKPDMWINDLAWPHLLEWNLFNSIMLPAMAFDFDGILCHDCAPGDDDDGPRYERFLADVRPMYYVRRTSIPLIVTARLEKYRPQTMAWLERHGMTVDKLIMGPWATLNERRRSDVAKYKASHYAAFRKRKNGMKPPIFVESDPHQAERIAHLSGGIVACPASGHCYL